jgi:hypothetical protein
MVAYADNHGSVNCRVVPHGRRGLLDRPAQLDELGSRSLNVMASVVRGSPDPAHETDRRSPLRICVDSGLSDLENWERRGDLRSRKVRGQETRAQQKPAHNRSSFLYLAQTDSAFSQTTTWQAALTARTTKITTQTIGSLWFARTA